MLVPIRSLTILVVCLAFCVPAVRGEVKKLTAEVPAGDLKLAVQFGKSRAVVSHAGDGSASAAGVEEQLLSTWHFETSADFPVSRYDSSATHQLEVALTIYEGMRVDLYESGKWEVSYTAAPTSIVVSAEIQIWLERDGRRVLLFSIPPAVFRPDRQEVFGQFATGVSVKKTNSFSQTGYSAAVCRHVQHLGQLPACSSVAETQGVPLRLVRTGRALVGFGSESLR